MKDSELVKQSLDFSVCVVEYYKFLVEEMKEYVISKQLLRSATSIGANIHEAKYASSRADFINKMYLSLKEASETEYWLIVLERTGYLEKENSKLKQNCESIKRMLVSTIKTAKSE